MKGGEYMFDTMKFNGDKIKASDMLINTSIEKIIGIYPVETTCDEDGERCYMVSDNPDGKLLVYIATGYTSPSAIFIGNDVETSQIIDLL